jgi:hypothetical protein
MFCHSLIAGMKVALLSLSDYDDSSMEKANKEKL